MGNLPAGGVAYGTCVRGKGTLNQQRARGIWRTAHVRAKRQPIDSWIDFILVRVHNGGQDRSGAPES